MFPLPFVLIGGLAVAVGFRDSSRSLDTEGWARAVGTVVASDVERGTGPKRGAIYRESIRYDYVVNGRDYTGDRVTYTTMWAGDRSRADRLVARYPVGADVTVHYDPNRPEQAVLETGVDGSAWVPIGIGLFFFTIGCALFALRHVVAGSPRRR